MYGIKVASLVVGLTLLVVGLVFGLVFGGIALLGTLWGGIAAGAIVLVLTFIAIAWAENSRF